METRSIGETSLESNISTVQGEHRLEGGPGGAKLGSLGERDTLAHTGLDIRRAHPRRKSHITAIPPSGAPCRVDVTRASQRRRSDISVRVKEGTLPRPSEERDLVALDDDEPAAGGGRRGRDFGRGHVCYCARPSRSRPRRITGSRYVRITTGFSKRSAVAGWGNLAMVACLEGARESG